MDFCPQHEKLMETVHNIDKVTTALSVRINGSISDIEKHMEFGAAWRIAIIGVIVSIILQVVTFSYLWGQASKQLAINTERISIMEQGDRDAQRIRLNNVTKIKELETRIEK